MLTELATGDWLNSGVIKAALMRSFRRLVTISFSLLAALIVSLLIVASISSRPPREDKILSNFRDHQTTYERVRTMLLEDKSVEGLAPWGIQTEGSPVWKVPPDGGMQLNRYHEYLSLLKEIGASRVGKETDPVEVSFGIWSSGFAGETRHVNICWLDREPLNTTISLDAFYQTAKPRTASYVHIDGNWYIWADW